jgi:hypothetical protein
LLFSLLPVAAVRPEFGALGGDDEGGHGAVKAGEPAARLPVFGDVFGEVRVGRGRYPGIEFGGFEGGTQGGDAFGGGVVVHGDSFCVWRVGVHAEVFWFAGYTAVCKAAG